jgi:hypothetical protein
MRDDKREIGLVFVSYRAKGIQKNETKIVYKELNRWVGELRKLRCEQRRAGTPSPEATAV